MTLARFAVAAPLGAFCSALACAGAPIYSNADAFDPLNPGLATGASTLSGVVAPQGFAWSEPQVDASGHTNAVAGLATHPASEGGAFRFADDFTIPDALGWRLDQATVFAYVPGWSSQASPFAAATVQVWDGPPGAPGSAVVFGDQAMNRLLTAAPTNMLRVFNTSVALAGEPDESRRVWAVDVALGSTVLPAGSYWLDFQLVPASAANDVFVPPLTLTGARTLSGWNAMQERPELGWTAVLDKGKPARAPDVALDLPFLLTGQRLTACPADLTGDGIVNAADLATLLGSWAGGPGPADISGDGMVNSADLAQMLGAWGGCP